MPNPLLIAAGIGAGASLLGSGINAASTGSMNKKTRKWNEHMYNVQREHALQDWAMQNAYNSPTKQMERLKEAGLNPHLVYGNGATAEGGAVRSTDVKGWNPDVPQVDLSAVSSGFSEYYRIQNQKAQTDNLAVQKTLMEQQAIHEAQKTLNTMAQTDKTKSETQTLEAMRETNLEAMRTSIEKMHADIQSTTDSNRRANEMQPGSLQAQALDIINKRLLNSKSVQETKQIQQAIKNMDIEKQLKEWELQIRKSGGNPNDPYWQKKVIDFLENGFRKKNPGKPWLKERETPQSFTDWLDRLSPY